MLDERTIVVPQRAQTRFAADGDEAVFELLESGRREAVPGALITITHIEGGAPRKLGTHMAVLADGRFAGYVSGGCVEAAVAGETIEALAENRDCTLRFGLNSPFVDVQLPCGGGIDLHVHCQPAPELVAEISQRLRLRRPFGLALDRTNAGSHLVEAADVPDSGWQGECFFRRYLPRTRLLLIGRGIELEELTRVARAARLDVHAMGPDRAGLDLAAEHGAETRHVTSPAAVPDLPIDEWTAAIMLFHDHDWETGFLAEMIESNAFFIGALGSRNTHAARVHRLRAIGISEEAIARIRGPIGLFGPTRDAASLALSVLGEVTEARRVAEGA